MDKVPWVWHTFFMSFRCVLHILGGRELGESSWLQNCSSKPGSGGSKKCPSRGSFSNIFPCWSAWGQVCQGVHFLLLVSCTGSFLVETRHPTISELALDLPFVRRLELYGQNEEEKKRYLFRSHWPWISFEVLKGLYNWVWYISVRLLCGVPPFCARLALEIQVF